MNNELIIMVGIPGAGKSTKCIEYEQQGYKVHSSDAIRIEKLGTDKNQEHNNYIFQIMKQRTEEDLKAGHSVVYDATNISRKRRRALIQQMGKHASTVKAHVILRPLATLLLYNMDRDFPMNQLRNYIRNFNMPTFTEGFDEITYSLTPNSLYEWSNSIDDIITFFKKVVTDGYIDMKLHPWYKRIHKYDQNNKYHTKTLDQHIYEVSKRAREFNDKEVLLAALFHDIGKPITRVPNNHGTSSYYGHENVSAYETAILLVTLMEHEEIKELNLDYHKIIMLIAYHMRMRNTQSKKAKNKLIEEIGRDLYPHLCELFVCDVSGK